MNSLDCRQGSGLPRVSRVARFDQERDQERSADFEALSAIRFSHEASLFCFPLLTAHIAGYSPMTETPADSAGAFVTIARMCV